MIQQSAKFHEYISAVVENRMKQSDVRSIDCSRTYAADFTGRQPALTTDVITDLNNIKMNNKISTKK